MLSPRFWACGSTENSHSPFTVFRILSKYIFAGPVGGKLLPWATRVLGVAVLVVAVLTSVASRRVTPRGSPGGGANLFVTGTRRFSPGLGRRRRLASSGTVFANIRSTQCPSGYEDGWPGTDAFGSSVMRVPPLRANTRGHNISGNTRSMLWPDGGRVRHGGLCSAPIHSVDDCRHCGGSCPCNPDDGLCLRGEHEGVPNCEVINVGIATGVTVREPCRETSPDHE